MSSLSTQRKVFESLLEDVEIETKRKGDRTQVFHLGKEIMSFKKESTGPSVFYLAQATMETSIYFEKKEDKGLWEHLINQVEIPQDLRVWYQDTAYKMLNHMAEIQFSSPKDIKLLCKVIVKFQRILNKRKNQAFVEEGFSDGYDDFRRGDARFGE